jgi:hypothetical protein
MAPRGIVAASTASTFGEQLAAQHVGGAAKILPVTFLVIVATVALYGLTAVPVARRLDVTRPARCWSAAIRGSSTSAAFRHGSGARITTQPAGHPIPPGADVLFLITPDGTLTPPADHPPASEPTGTLVLLGPAPATGGLPA